MKRLYNDEGIEMKVDGPVKAIQTPNCEDCIMGKMTRLPFVTSQTITSRPGELVYSDLEGPFPIPSILTKALYYVSYLDRHTKKTSVYLLQKKSD